MLSSFVPFPFQIGLEGKILIAIRWLPQGQDAYRNSEFRDDLDVKDPLFPEC